MTDTTAAPGSGTRDITWTWAVLTAITVLVLALTLVKVHLIVRNFMEVHTAPRWLRRSMAARLIVLFAVVFAIYLV